MRRVPTVSEYMTRSPHWIGAREALSEARSFMTEYKIRHLPVLKEGRLVGVLSDRDLHVVQSIAQSSFEVRGEAIPVEFAMTPDPYAVAPSTPVDEVARVMAERKYGSAVVIERGVVIGVFTTTDALRALADALQGAA